MVPFKIVRCVIHVWRSFGNFPSVFQFIFVHLHTFQWIETCKMHTCIDFFDILWTPSASVFNSDLPGSLCLGSTASQLKFICNHLAWTIEQNLSNCNFYYSSTPILPPQSVFVKLLATAFNYCFLSLQPRRSNPCLVAYQAIVQRKRRKNAVCTCFSVNNPTTKTFKNRCCMTVNVSLKTLCSMSKKGGDVPD